MKYFQSRVAIFIISIFVLSFINARAAYADTASLGPVMVDVTLDPSTTYVVDGMVVVYAGDTLTVPAGTQFIFTPGSYLRVDGTLDTNGTPTKHVTISGGLPPSIIPVLPLAKTFSIVKPDTETPDTQTLDVQEPEIQPSPDATADEVETPEVQSPDVTTAVVSNGMMMADDIVAPAHYGILFTRGSSGSLSYTDIDDGIDGMTVDTGATVTDSHGIFSNCTTGILGAGGTLKLTSGTFNDVQTPADWDFHDTFTHSNTAFNNTQLNGWLYGGDIVSGQTMKLNSTDGEYSIRGVTVAQGGSLVVSPGVTIIAGDNQTVLIGGTMTALGTADNPITIYGDGSCPTHSAVIAFNNAASSKLEHIDFKNLCSGISISQSTVKFDNDTFDIIAGTAVTADDYGIVDASNISMNDVYQAFHATAVSQLKISDSTVTTVNSNDPAIAVDDDTPMSLDTVSVSNAPVCVGFSNDASLTATGLTLSHCSIDGILSDDSSSAVSSITLTDSEVMDSGTAMNLDNALVTEVSNDKFHDNTVGVSLTDMPKTVIANNWWGSNTGPDIDSNPGGDGDSIAAQNVPEVVYRPWIGMADAAARNPIIIVPGITGSVLDKDYGDDGEIWPNLTKLALSPTDSFLDDLELLQDGTQSIDRPMKVGDVIRSVSSVDVFGSMIAALTKDGYTEGTNLFVLPYDWRLSNTANQALLKTAIANALDKSGKAKVNIIAHSMGGLLVQDYIAQHPTAPIDHLFYIGVPHIGAPKAFQSLMYGDDMGFTFTVAGLHIPLLSAATVKTITQNMPAVYELLPSQKYIDTVGSYLTDLTQSALSLNLSGIEAFMTADGRNAKMFSFAKALHDVTDKLNGALFPTYDFAGCGSTKTIGSYAVSKEQSFSITGMKIVPEHHIYYTNGDGVVPVSSATADGGSSDYYVTSGSHGTLPSVPQIQDSIMDILEGGSATTGTGISSNSNNCALSGKVVEVHSPVTLDIYDEEGDHTGPTADGEIEYGIPNVDYEMINDEKFAFLPSGQDYKIVNHAEAVGTYDMYVSYSNPNDSVTNREYFSQIPITSTNAVGSMAVTSLNSQSYELDVDEQGDGSDIEKFNPIGTNAWLNDVTPPITTAVVAGDAVILSAHDSVSPYSSGILNTKYSIDGGLTWSIYHDPFEVAPGTTVQYVSLDNAGNTEDIKQITVPLPSSGVTAGEAQTPATTATTPQGPDNNYYYGGTTVNEAPADTATNTDADTSKDTDDDSQPSSETTTSQSQTPDTKVLPITPPSADVSTPATIAEHITSFISSLTGHNPADEPITAMNTDQKNQNDTIAKNLLASAASTVLNSAGLLITILAALCAIVAILVTRRVYSKKNKDRLE